MISGTATTTLTAMMPSVTRVCGSARPASRITAPRFTASPSTAKAPAGQQQPAHRRPERVARACGEVRQQIQHPALPSPTRPAPTEARLSLTIGKATLRRNRLATSRARLETPGGSE